MLYAKKYQSTKALPYTKSGKWFINYGQYLIVPDINLFKKKTELFKSLTRQAFLQLCYSKKIYA